MTALFSRPQRTYYRWRTALATLARRFPGVSPLLDAWQNYTRDEMGMLAAGLAYYFLLALFPLLLLLIALASPFLNSDQVLRQVSRFAASYLPTLGPEIRPILSQVLAARGPVTVVAVFGLIWSSSGVFDLVQRGLNRAWQVPRPRAMWQQRLFSIVAVLAIGFFFALSFATSALNRAGIHLRVDFGSTSVELVGLGLALVLNAILFALIYRYLPNLSLSWRDVRSGALFASVVWELVKYLFVWYLMNFARLNMVYGSVGAVIAILVWGYITASILLYGAELCARQFRTLHDRTRS